MSLCILIHRDVIGRRTVALRCIKADPLDSQPSRHKKTNRWTVSQVVNAD